jgi:hypothetical protein
MAAAICTKMPLVEAKLETSAGRAAPPIDNLDET